MKPVESLLTRAIEGEVVYSSLAESLAGAVLFALIALLGAVVAAIPFLSGWSGLWYINVGLLIVGPVMLIGGILAARAMLAGAFTAERLVIGSDRIQLIHGKDGIVKGQIPYANIASIEVQKDYEGVGNRGIGITLRDWNDPETHWPGGLDGYQMMRKEGWHEIGLGGLGYKVGPKKLMGIIRTHYDKYQNSSGGEAARD